MQIKNNSAKNLQNPWLIGTIKLMLLVSCLYFILTKLQKQAINFDGISYLENVGITVILVSLLMVFNWYLEALRWKVSLQHFESISIKKAWQVILGGLALNWVLPFTSGDLLARVSQQEDKYQATSAALLNRAIMMGFTLILGMYGTSHLAKEYNLKVWFIAGTLGAIFLILFFFKKPLVRFVQYFTTLNTKAFVLIVLISFLRYLVFVFQFYLLLKLFLPALSFGLLVGGIGWVFLVRSILPLFFGGVGVREASGILFFEPHISDLQLVIAPIFLIWIINTVIPSLVGLVFVLKSKPDTPSID